MSNQVTEEMISAFIDGELSPEDKIMVENAISTDDVLRSLLESYRESSSAIKASSEFVSNSVALPLDFTSRVMGQIEIGETSDTVQPDQELNPASNSFVPETALDGSPSTSSSKIQKSNLQELGEKRPAPTGLFSIRTLVEVVVATVAIAIVTANWPATDPADNQIAKPGTEKVTPAKPNNGVHMMGSENGEFKKSPKANSTDPPKPSQSTSRKFSVFVKSDARPQVDRFWIMNNYEVTAPEGVEPENDAKVNVLLIDTKKADAVKFFAQLTKWDSGFQVFQEAKSGNASWLAPFDVSKAEQAEGDFWTLQIVVIEK